MQAQLQGDLALQRERNEITRQQYLLEPIAALELGQRGVRIVVRVVTVDEVRDSALSADIHGGGNQCIGGPLVAMLLLADDLNQFGAGPDVDHPDITDQLLSHVCAEKGAPARVCRMLVSN